MSSNHDLKKLVAELVQEHFELETDLEQIIWLKKRSANEIRLLEVNRLKIEYPSTLSFL